MGSIRIPAAWCGLFGLKPQRDRVPVAPKRAPWHGLSVNGVLTRSVADTALFLDCVSAPAGSTQEAAPAPAIEFSRAALTVPDRLRIAYSRRIPPGTVARVEAETVAALEETVELLRSLGHEVEERDPDYGMAATAAVARYLRGIHDDARAMAHPERLERRSRGMGRLGAMVSPALLERALAAEASLARRMNEVLEQHDLLLTPATATPPPRIGQLEGRGALWTLNAVAAMVPFNGVWNMTGQPAASVPARLGSDGLPRAVQIVGRANGEAAVLSLAAQIEAARPWAQRRPAEFV